MARDIKKYCLIHAYILILAALVLIFNIFKQNYYNFEIKSLSTIVEPVSVNLSFDKKIENSGVLVCFNYYCMPLRASNNSNTYNLKYNEKYIVNSAHLELPPDISPKDINYIYIYSGNKSYHYNKEDIKNFKSSSQKTGSIKLNLPKVDNYAGKFNHFCVLFLSIFYNAGYFVVPYLLLLIGFLMIFFVKDIKLSPKLIIPITLIAIVLRMDNITYVPLWIDELYTKYFALENFKSTFMDPGNPPLYFILEYIFTKIFSNSDLSLRFLSVVFGILTIPTVWLLFKKVSQNFALFASFMAAINTHMIYRSQEARSYSLDVFLTVAAIYILFKCIENPNIKNIILNAIMTVLLVNTNYYLVMIAVGNVLWGTIFIKENKLKFLISNFIASLTVLPYLLISLKNALDSTFNPYIPTPSKAMFSSMVHYYFLNNTIATTVILIVVINFILYFIPKIKMKNKYYPYLFYIFNFTVIFATLVSIYIRPMMYRGNIIAIYGVFFLLVVSSIYPVIEIKNKFAKLGIILYTILTTFMFFNMTYTYHERNIDNIKNFADFVEADAKKYHSEGYEIHGILPHVLPDVREYKSLEKLDYIKWHIVRMGSDDSYIKKQHYTSKENKVVIYIPLLGTEYFLREKTDNLFINMTNNVTNVKLVY